MATGSNFKSPNMQPPAKHPGDTDKGPQKRTSSDAHMNYGGGRMISADGEGRARSPSNTRDPDQHRGLTEKPGQVKASGKHPGDRKGNATNAKGRP